jgi:choice-of-anchor B domain-containing protein
LFTLKFIFDSYLILVKKLLKLVLLICIGIQAQAQLNVTFRSNLQYPGQALSNIGGYVDSSGNEYALVGYSGGLDIVDVTDPANPFVAHTVPGTNSSWREVKTWQNYAYVTTEGCCNGLQIVNLGYLPDSVTYTYWTGSGSIAGQIETIHALHVEDGYAYLFGSNLFNGAAIIADLSNPWNPSYVGKTPGSYIHDGYVRGNYLYSAHIYDGFFSVFDITNKSNPVLITTQLTPTQFTHNTWLNDAGNVLFTTDENTGSYLGAYDISDLNNITELDRVQVTPGSGSIIHNTHTLNDFEIVSWYKDGIAIVDVSRPDNMIVTGSYDTYTQGSGSGFNGAWGVYPFLPSGNLVVSDINNGLYVLTPDYIRACYLEGLVTDSATGAPLNNVLVTIIGPGTTDNSKLNGEYKTGLAQSGTYSVQFSKSGYTTKTITGVSLVNGQLTVLNVALSTSSPTITVSGTVTEAGTGNPIPGAIVLFKNLQFDFTVQADANGQFSISNFFGGTYDVTAGHWGHRTFCTTGQNLNVSGPYSITLQKGYYDDFSLDFGWTVSGPSGNAWERSVPIATTTQQGQTANPGTDIFGDCQDLAMVTDNGGGGAWDNDVDQGSTILNSPTFDLTTYQNPVIQYKRWFFNGGTTNGAPDDSMKVFLSNGTVAILVESLGPAASTSQWNQATLNVGGFLTPTSTMQFIVDVGDPGPIFNIVEGGLDAFEVVEATSLSESNRSSFNAWPNPFSESLYIDLGQRLPSGTILEVTDTQGRLVQRVSLGDNTRFINLGQDWTSGVYVITPLGETSSYAPLRVVKR